MSAKVKLNTSANYTAVTFKNIQDAKDVVKYNIPVGAQIKTTKQVYSIKKDGVYNADKKLDSINLPTFGLAALKSFDANKDNHLDPKDIQLFKEAKDRKFGNVLNDNLIKENSDHRVVVLNSEDGGMESAYITNTGFKATFVNEYTNDKSLSLILPKKAASGLKNVSR
jgi:hypothetical protein